MYGYGIVMGLVWDYYGIGVETPLVLDSHRSNIGIVIEIVRKLLLGLILLLLGEWYWDREGNSKVLS